MKKRLAICNAVLALAVLFAMLFQSVHSFEHLAAQFSEKKCHHQYKSATEITHQHHNFDHCKLCDVTFSNFLSSEILSFKLHTPFLQIRLIASVAATPPGFSGSNYSDRGPPSFIV